MGKDRAEPRSLGDLLTEVKSLWGAGSLTQCELRSLLPTDKEAVTPVPDYEQALELLHQRELSLTIGSTEKKA